jgi:hypothetical protein
VRKINGIGGNVARRFYEAERICVWREFLAWGLGNMKETVVE